MATTHSVLQNNISQHFSDPNFLAILDILPNPDPILRKMGVSQEIYTDIMYDAHLLGEIRTIRTGLVSYKSKVSPGGESKNDLDAYELCKKVFKRPPSENLTWKDTTWEIGQAPFRGMSVIQIEWMLDNGKIIPSQLTDWPNDRFIFNKEGKLRVLTKDEPINGIETHPQHWLINRHMASCTNKYGVALLSACFWPYTFKRGGFKFFVKFCEKYGIPWGIAKYKAELEEKKQDIVNDLADMVEDAVGAFPEGAEIELITTSISGELVHERLINLCNAEMSKVITSQTLATEIKGNGSKAAAETHHKREKGGNHSDREDVAEIYNQLFRFITELNFPPGTNHPIYEFYEEAKPQTQWAEFIEQARKHVDVPKLWAYEKMGIPVPQAKDEVLPILQDSGPAPANFSGVNTGYTFASTELDEIDKDIESGILGPLYEKLLEYEKAGKTIEEFQADLGSIIRDFDTSAAERTTKELLQYAFAKGMTNAR